MARQGCRHSSITKPIVAVSVLHSGWHLAAAECGAVQQTTAHTAVLA